MIPSMTQVKKILRESAVDPRKDAWFQSISDIADSIYLQKRAIELLRQNLQAHDQRNLKMAISLIALARTKYAAPEGPKPKNRVRKHPQGGVQTEASGSEQSKEV